MKEIEGNLITLAKHGEFDIIAHGCNCFCTMGAGIAPQIKEAFPSAWAADLETVKGDIRKLGDYTFGRHRISNFLENDLIIINAYTQYKYGANHIDGVTKPFDYQAFTICMRKINHIYKGKRIGLPLIGSGLGGGNWEVIKAIIKTELKDMDVIIVHYKK